MPTTTVQLLKLPPLSALLILINESLKLRLNPNQIKATKVVKAGETKTVVTLEAFKPVSTFSPQLYTGRQDFTYDRLRLQDVFGTQFRVALPLRATVEDVLRLLTANTGIAFDDNDFEKAIVNVTPYRLKPKAGSLRWVGELQLVLSHPTDEIELATVVADNSLDGLSAHASSGE